MAKELTIETIDSITEFLVRHVVMEFADVINAESTLRLRILNLAILWEGLSSLINTLKDNGTDATVDRIAHAVACAEMAKSQLSETITELELNKNEELN